jgi:cytoskeletal protein CcmA (bactofilin family)
MEYRRPDPGNESVIDAHARFNGKYVSDRDLRIEGEATGEIECTGSVIISPQAKVRSAISAANVIVNGDYEGDITCNGRFEIGSTGRMKGKVRAQVLVIREGAFFDGAVTMGTDARSASTPTPAQASAPAQGKSGSTAQPAASSAAQGSIFKEAAPAGERAATGPGTSS